ncbi:MAG: hypothetical protein ACE5I1_14360 [bacterium]
MQTIQEERDLALMFTKLYGGLKFAAGQYGMSAKQVNAYLETLKKDRPEYYAKLEKDAHELEGKMEQ